VVVSTVNYLLSDGLEVDVWFSYCNYNKDALYSVCKIILVIGLAKRGFSILQVRGK
jgi:hypothetical protein